MVTENAPTAKNTLTRITSVTWKELRLKLEIVQLTGIRHGRVTDQLKRTIGVIHVEPTQMSTCFMTSRLPKTQEPEP